MEVIGTHMSDPTTEKIKQIAKARWAMKVYHREFNQICGSVVSHAAGEHSEIIFVWRY